MLSPPANLKDLSCPICLGVLVNPVECAICETAYCEGCLGKYGKSKCPMKCSDELQIKKKCHKIIRNGLASLKLKCRFQTYGCRRSFNYDAYLTHVGVCDHRVMPCIAYSKCSKMDKISEIHEHQDVCGFVEIQCEYCKTPYLRNQKDKHMRRCKEKIDMCRWCNEFMDHRALKSHESKYC